MRTLLVLLWLGCVGCVTAPTKAPTVYDTGVNSEAWAHVPAGEFFSGQWNERVTMDRDYEIMVTDVTNAQYARYLNEALAKRTARMANGNVVGYYPGDVFHNARHEKRIEAGDHLHVPIRETDVRLTFDGAALSVKAGYEDHPMVAVTWFGAKAFCDFYGWRLPTEKEWEKAARGAALPAGHARAYPWGDEIENGNANFYASGDPFERTTGKQGDTTPVGFYNGKTYDGYRTLASVSPYGLYDMAGDVWQWTGDVYEGQHYRYLRGGSKGDSASYLRVWWRNNAEPDYASPSVGFRCAR